MSREPYVDGKTAAEYLGLSPKTLERRVHERTVPFHKCGRAVRYRLSELDAWVEQCTREALEAAS